MRPNPFGSRFKPIETISGVKMTYSHRRGAQQSDPMPNYRALSAIHRYLNAQQRKVLIALFLDAYEEGKIESDFSDPLINKLYKDIMFYRECRDID